MQKIKILLLAITAPVAAVLYISSVIANLVTYYITILPVMTWFEARAEISKKPGEGING